MILTSGNCFKLCNFRETVFQLTDFAEKVREELRKKTEALNAEPQPFVTFEKPLNQFRWSALLLAFKEKYFQLVENGVGFSFYSNMLSCHFDLRLKLRCICVFVTQHFSLKTLHMTIDVRTLVASETTLEVPEANMEVEEAVVAAEEEKKEEEEAEKNEETQATDPAERPKTPEPTSVPGKNQLWCSVRTNFGA